LRCVPKPHIPVQGLIPANLDPIRPSGIAAAIAARWPHLGCRRTFIALLPIGYPMGGFGPVRRVPLADVVFEDRWGQPYRDQGSPA
jgi:hypothetical protein